MKYEIEEKELVSLIKRDAKLCALENGGVDNWEWYGESLKDYNDEVKIDLSKYISANEEIFEREYKNNQDLYYNNNPCKFVAYLSKDIAVIIVAASPDYHSINGSQWCTPCNIGGTSTHTHSEYDEVIDALRDNDNPTLIPLIIDVKFLRREPIVVFQHKEELSKIDEVIKIKKEKAIALAKTIAEQESIIERNKKEIEAINKINNI